MRLKYASYCLSDDYENDHKACPLLGSLHTFHYDWGRGGGMIFVLVRQENGMQCEVYYSHLKNYLACIKKWMMIESVIEFALT